jgi:hypothetical protein
VAGELYQRLIVFMDEIDVLLSVDFREQIFSKFRTSSICARGSTRRRCSACSSCSPGAAHSSRFIKDPRWSPFNVAIEIELGGPDARAGDSAGGVPRHGGQLRRADLTARVFELSGGSVFLCQLIFEQLWNQARARETRLGAADVDAVVATIVAESPRNIHFYNIFRLVTADARSDDAVSPVDGGPGARPGGGQGAAPDRHLSRRQPVSQRVYARCSGPAGRSTSRSATARSS